MKRYTIFVMCCCFFTASAAPRQHILHDTLKISELPDLPFLPDPLILDEGGTNVPITGKEQWRKKREWIKQQYQYWVAGSVPPAPGSIHVKVLSEKEENGVKLRMAELSFGPGNIAKLTVELLIPPSKKPLPVFMTQWNHRGWAQIAVRRGYIGCVYAGADARDDTKNYVEIYPDYDFATLMRRAWAAHRAVDYLYTLPEVDTACIALTGHSRNGKQSLMAAAFDERIKAVVGSSGLTGAGNVFRFADERSDTESIEEITRKFPYWFHPRLRLFAGREQKLPVDQNLLMALIAPRGLMISSAITEGQGNPWAIEQSYRSVRKVYGFLGEEDKLGIWLRDGRHATSSRDIENYIDFFDYIFGRSDKAPENRLCYNYSFSGWKELSGENIRAAGFPEHHAVGSPVRVEQVREKISWLLGVAPPGVSNIADIGWKNRKHEDDFWGDVIGQPRLSNTGIQTMTIGPYNSLGDYLWANLYFPPGTIKGDSISKKVPLVIFLHEYAYATGYRRRSEPFIRNFTEKGFAVLAFDMIGFGTRIEEATRFYKRYPHWSLMGKMVADTRAIIDDVCGQMPFIDKNNIFLSGYALGGTVALLTAALEDRVRGAAVASAFDSFRTDDPGTEGNRHYSHLHGLLPRLGFFEQNEQRIPLDFDDVLAVIAPRELLIIAPARDRHHPIGEVRKMIANASSVYDAVKASGNLVLLSPDIYNSFPDVVQKEMAKWMHELICPGNGQMKR